MYKTAQLNTHFSKRPFRDRKPHIRYIWHRLSLKRCK